MNTVSTILFAFLVSSLLFLSLPEEGNAGMALPDFGCCQFESECADIEGNQEEEECIGKGGEVFPGQICLQNDMLCTGNEPVSRNIPTFSEWGLIAMAGILGLVAFMAIRKRKASA